MTNNNTSKAMLVASAGINPHQEVQRLALVNATGTDIAIVTKQAAQADTVAADLAALKVDFNLLLAKLRLANILS